MAKNKPAKEKPVKEVVSNSDKGQDGTVSITATNVHSYLTPGKVYLVGKATAEKLVRQGKATIVK